MAQAQEVRFIGADPGPNGSVAERRPTIVVRVANAGRLSEYTVAIDGTRVDGNVSREGDALVVRGVALADGRHRLQVRGEADGFFGGSITRHWTFTVDTTAPPLDVAEVPAVTSEASVTVAGESEAGARIEVRDGEALHRAVAGADGTFSLPIELAEGDHELEISAGDRAGNRTAEARAVAVDTSEPVIDSSIPRVVDTPTPNLAVAVRDATEVRVSATVDGDPVRLDDEAPAPLADGQHLLVIEATDAAGNVARGRVGFVVDSTERLGGATLVAGARGEDVRTLQRKLRQLGYLRSRPTGVLGGRTLAAVRSYQRASGLAADGVVGPMTFGSFFGRIVIDQSDHLLTLYRPGKPTLSYGVAVGAAEFPTPNGDFNIISMIEDPTWVPPDSDWAAGLLPVPPGPNNPLGTRWMGISSPGIGIHGTPDPRSIGYSASHGCVRMRIPDAEALFDMVQIGMRVQIQP